MQRPFISKSFKELEEIFRKASREKDHEFLTLLDHELTFRQKNQKTPDLRKDVARSLAKAATPQADIFPVTGNHESLLLRAIEGDDFDVYRWISQGGDAALQSYGLPTVEQISSETIRKAIGSEHLACMEAAEHYVELEHHILVHAGVRAGIAIEDQSHHDLMLIRDGFLDCVESFGKIIVHGHTPNVSKEVEVWPNRIAIDTFLPMRRIFFPQSISRLPGRYL